MKTVNVGSIVEATCGKCNDTMGHVVVAMVAGAIVKVECKACGSVHKFRPAGTSLTKPEIVAKSPPAPRSAKASSPRKAAATATSLAANAEWQKVLERAHTEKPAPYSTQNSYTKNELLSHPTFGVGVVMDLIPTNKIDVLFENGIKRLLHKV